MQPDHDRAIHLALTTGALAGTLMQATGRSDHPFYGYTVNVNTDASGNYTRSVELVSPSGHVYTISVFEEWNLHEALHPAA